jgi:uncharacterized protein YbaP (TraB family)
MSRRAAVLAGLCLAFAAGSAVQAEEPELETLVVNGEQPGPGLWEFRHGDHHLWVLATVSPLPKELKWRSKQLEQVIAQSQLVIAPARVDVNVGFFKSLTLLPLALRMGDLPNKQHLKDVLPPSTYARWSSARQRHAPRDDDLETNRPLFAGGQLYDKALKRAGLERRTDVWKQVEQLAKTHKVTVREPSVELDVKDPKALLREFVDTPPVSDVPCFESLLTRIESQLPVMQQRALAWAKGDVNSLKRLSVEDTQSACMNVFTGTPRLAAKFDEGMRRWRQEWVLAAEGALLRNQSSVAVVSLGEFLGGGGLAAQMRARGYELIEPDSH